MGMTKQNIQKAINALKTRLTETWGRDTEIYLFGSAARGEAKQDSDIDVLILIPGDVNNALEEEIFGLAFDVELEYNVVFGIVVRSKTFWNSKRASAMPLYQSLQKEGIRV